jgi:hypothetical protein
MIIKKSATPTTSYMTRAIGGIVLMMVVILTIGCNPKSPETEGSRFNHVMLYVSDLDESIRFYQNAFGMRLDQKLDH